MKQWAKSILFARYEYTIEEAEGYGKNKAKSTGRRVAYTQWNAAFDAGSRYELPPVLPLDYAEYAAAREKGRVASPERLAEEATSLLARWAPLNEEDKKKAVDAIAAATGDSVKLARIVDRLKTKVAEKENS